MSSPVNQSNVQGLSRAYLRVAELHTFDYRAASSRVGQPLMNAALARFADQVAAEGRARKQDDTSDSRRQRFYRKSRH